jgi:hypothetical protein
MVEWRLASLELKTWDGELGMAPVYIVSKLNLLPWMRRKLRSTQALQVWTWTGPVLPWLPLGKVWWSFFGIGRAAWCLWQVVLCDPNSKFRICQRMSLSRWRANIKHSITLPAKLWLGQDRHKRWFQSYFVSSFIEGEGRQCKELIN